MSDICVRALSRGFIYNSTFHVLGMAFASTETAMGVARRLLLQLTLCAGFATVRWADSNCCALCITNLPIGTSTLLATLGPWSPRTWYAINRTLNLAVARSRFDQTVARAWVVTAFIAIMGSSNMNGT